MRNIKKQNVKRNPRVTRVSTPKPRSAQSKHHAAYRKAHPSSGRPKPIRRQGAGRRPIALGVQVAYAEVSPKVPPKVNPKVTRTHQVRHTTRNVQDANALGRFTADVGHGARTTVESYNFINPQTRSLRESTLFEVGVGTLTGQYTPEQGWGEAGRRVTEQPGRVVGEAAVEVGTALIPIGALFKATKIASVASKLIGKRKFTSSQYLGITLKRKNPRNYGDKKLKIASIAALNYYPTIPKPVATKAFSEVIDYGATKTTYTDNTASAIRSAKGDLAKTENAEDLRIFHVGSGVKDISPDGYRPVSPSELGWNPPGGKKFGALVEPKGKSTITRKKILPGLYKETEITPVGAFTEKTKVIKTAPGEQYWGGWKDERGAPWSQYYTKPGKTYEVEDWRAGGPQYAPVEYKDAVYFSAPVKVKGLTKKLKKAEERGAVIKTEETLVPYGKWYTVIPEQSAKYGPTPRPPNYKEWYDSVLQKKFKHKRLTGDTTRIIKNTKWKYEDVPISVTETRYTGPVASLGRTAPITGTIGASVGVLGYAEFSDSSVGQGGIRTKVKKAVGAI